MPPKKEKKLLRTFLVQCLDKGQIKGIRWVNKEDKTWQLLWLHANSPEWSEEYGAIFKEWAIYKGRYKRRSDGTWPENDYTNWKANFRCAVNRCHDIEEIKMDTGNKDLKTYRFKPRRHEDVWNQCQLSPNTTRQNEVSDEQNAVYRPTASTSQGITTQSFPAQMQVSTDTYATAAFLTAEEVKYVPEVVNSIPVTVNTPPVVDSNMQTVASQTPDLLQQMVDGCNVNDVLPYSDFDVNVNILMDKVSLEAPGIDPQHISTVSLPDSLSMVRFVNTTPQMDDIIIWLRYREKVVSKHYIRCDRGCRIINCDGVKRSEIPEKFVGGKLVGTPAPGVHVQRDIETTENIINSLGNGLHILCDTDGNIHATRISSCRIFYADPNVKNAAEPQLLPRKQTVKVFDRNTFIQKLAAWEKNKTSGERPSISILFGLGESWSLTKPINKCRVNVMVVHCNSWDKRMSVKHAETVQIEEDVDRACAPSALLQGWPVAYTV